MVIISVHTVNRLQLITIGHIAGHQLLNRQIGMIQFRLVVAKLSCMG